MPYDALPPPPSPPFGVERQEVVGEDYSGRRERSWVNIESTFEDCSFESVRVGQFSFGGGRRPSIFRRCSFDNANIRAEIPGRVLFEECTFYGARLTKWICKNVEMINCSFDGAVLRDCLFNAEVDPMVARQTGRLVNRFVGNDFSGAEFYGVSFRGGVDLTKQKVPNAPGYQLVHDAQRVLKAVLDSVEEWAEPDYRDIAETFLSVRLFSMGPLQQQSVLSPNDFAVSDPIKREAYERVRVAINQHLSV